MHLFNLMFICTYVALAHSFECGVSCVYAALSGRCNNLCHRAWGTAVRPFARLLNPKYCKGEETRCAKSGRPLPNAHTLSLMFFQDKPDNILDKFLTSAHMTFGQFIAHDFGRRNEQTPNDENGVDHCGLDQCKESEICTPFKVLPTDPHFKPPDCLRFQRSPRHDSPDHDFKEQLNEVTSYLDFHMIYGVLPQETLPARDPRPADLRVKEQPQLTVLHTIYNREHNRLVDGLRVVNPCWSEERLFLEAHKIQRAVWQYVVFHEYLPLFFSEATRKKWNLNLHHSGYTKDYDKKINATVANAFVTASFRFGHSQIPVGIAMADCKDFRLIRSPAFSSSFNNPTLAYFPETPDVTAIDAIACGMIGASAEKADDSFNEQLTVFFDAEVVNTTSRDLEAQDIQRGRDHGLPGYNDWLEFCGFDRADTFDDFKFIPPHQRTKLANIYEDPDDVDLFLAGMVEMAQDGDLSGPTFTCLNAQQFRKARFGDRFWHEEQRGGFSVDQLQNIREMTTGKVFCDNLDNLDKVQPFTMAHPRSIAESLTNAESHWDFDLVYDKKLGTDNERVPCSSLPGINFSLWKEDGCWYPNCKHYN